MRVTTFIFVIFLCVLCAFWGFVWYNRTALVEQTLTRSLAPYHVHIDHVEKPNNQTLVCYGITVCSPNDVLIATMPQLTMVAPTNNWIRWLCTSDPLSLTSVAMTLTKCPTAMEFEPNSFKIPAHVETAIVYQKGRSYMWKDLEGSIQQIITTLLTIPVPAVQEQPHTHALSY